VWLLRGVICAHLLSREPARVAVQGLVSWSIGVGDAVSHRGDPPVFVRGPTVVLRRGR
jgi:hypothetical protein